MPGALDLLALQRHAGNAAVTREIRRRAAAGTLPAVSSRAPGAMAIQRLIGFEMETRVPVYELTGGGPVDMDYDELHANANAGDNSEFGIDKEGKKSILEFVSTPVDDTQKSSAFKTTATRWVNALVTARQRAQTQPHPKQLNDFYNPAPDDVHFGKLNNGSPTNDYNKVAIQVTHGVQLSKVADLMKKTKLQNPTGAGRVDKKNESLGDTKGKTNSVMAQLKTIVDPKTSYPKSSERTKAVKDVEGIMALLSHYLLLGGKDIQAYIKNQTTLFYKSKLSDVVLENYQTNQWLKDLIGQPDVRDQVIAALLQVTNRTGNTPLFRGSKVPCEFWLEEVLSGSDDPIFEEAKNPWGNEIDPGQVKGKNAVVLEHRDLASEFPFSATMNLDNPDEVVKYLVKFYQRNKKMQGL